MINYIRYYLNIAFTRIKRRYIIKYNKFTSSHFFDKEHPYANNIIHLVDDSNKFLCKQVISGRPFMVARFGSNELYNLEVFDLKIEIKYKNALDMLCHNAGFFPNDLKYGFQFSEIMKAACAEVDMMAIWNMFMEEYYIKKCMKKEVYLTQLRFLEPWYSNYPWTQALKGKKVLVIHPFAKTISEQYKKRKVLFENVDILPEFELFVLKAVQTIGGQKDERFETWFSALDYMYKETIKMEFDIALLGCGAYGFPLAARLKKEGKQVVHMGGVLQILFGIKGARWDTDPVVSKLYNEYWVRPSEEERPSSANSIERGCYW